MSLKESIGEKLSFSMFIDEEIVPKNVKDFKSTDMIIESIDSITNFNLNSNKPPLYRHLHRRRVHNWVKDETVTHCHECKCQFGMFVRKHHCRACGRIFCNTCSSYYLNIENYSFMPQQPEEGITSVIEKYLSGSKGKAPSRVCINCYNKIKEMNRLESFINVLSFLEYNDIFKMKLVSKKWYKGVIFYLSRLREIQYNLPFKKLTSFEEQILVAASNNYAGHSRWRTCLLRAISMNPSLLKNEQDKENILKILTNNKKETTCWRLMCTRNCTEHMKPKNMIEIISVTNPDKYFHEFILNTLLDATDKEFLSYVHVINKFIIRNKCYYFYNQIIKRYHINKFLLIDIYNNLRYFYNDKESFTHYKKFISKLKGDLLPFMDENDRTIDSLNRVLNNSHDPSMKNYQNIYIPFFEFKNKDKINRYSIDFNKTEIKESANKPIILTLKNSTNNKKILLKNECLKKDYIITKIISLIDHILKRRLGIDFHIINYNILPSEENNGIIEIVENAETLFNIANGKKFSIQNFIIESNPELTVKQIRDKFVRSTAAYCVITYLLGIGDRHLDNIMVHKSGSLFHIDYGYIFGNDPKLTDPFIRITPGMLDAMGGENSLHYKHFKELCVKIYEVLRQHINLLTSMMVELIELDPELDFDKYEAHILKRFEPGLNMNEAENTLFKMMDKSKSNSWRYNIIDFFHSGVRFGYNILPKITG